MEIINNLMQQFFNVFPKDVIPDWILSFNVAFLPPYSTLILLKVTSLPISHTVQVLLRKDFRGIKIIM